MTRLHGGLGLGLSIVKQLVELHHGGTVSAKSAGEGRARVLSYLSRCGVMKDGDSRRSDAVNFDQSLVIDSSAFHLRGVRVLVVDDEPDSRELITRLLDKHEADVLAAGSADEALKLYRVFKPHVLVSDIGLPEKDGYQLIREIRAAGSTIPAVALTAFARSEDRQRAMLAGYQVHVAKPLDPQELVITVASLLRRAANWLR